MVKLTTFSKLKRDGELEDYIQLQRHSPHFLGILGILGILEVFEGTYFSCGVEVFFRNFRNFRNFRSV
jgi:hypothetical protein